MASASKKIGYLSAYYQRFALRTGISRHWTEDSKQLKDKKTLIYYLVKAVVSFSD